MNILFFCDHPIIATGGGISRITDSLVGVFRNYNHNVFIISAKTWPDAKVDKNHFYFPNPKYDEECLLYAEDFCRKNEIELIINQSPDRNSIPFLKKLKDVYNVNVYSCIHNCTLTPILNYAYQKEFELRKKKLTPLFYLLKNKFVKKIISFFYYLKYRNLYTKIALVSDKVLVLNEKLIGEFQFFIPKNYYSKIAVIPNCLPIREWNPTMKKEKIVLWVGRIDVTVKRIDLMLKAWQLICKSTPEWKLFVLGDGPYLNYARNFATTNHLKNIFFEGRVNPYPYYEKASLVAVTSSHESFSLVTLEALQHNVVPVVMNTFPFASTLIQNGINGILVDEYNYESLANALRTLMNDENMMQNIAEKGNTRALDYSPDKIYWKYWRNLLQVDECMQ